MNNTSTVTAVVIPPVPAEPRYRITLDLSKADAQGVANLCASVGGVSTSPRNVFDKISDALGKRSVRYVDQNTSGDTGAYLFANYKQ
jgi:hypothetical protein